MELVERLRDSAYPGNLDPAWPNAIGGYLQSPHALNPWTLQDWMRFPGRRKLPIFEQPDPGSSHAWLDARYVVDQLFALRVPRGRYHALAMETAIDVAYVTDYGNEMHAFGYKTWVYGSADSVFGNPALNGYWVADYREIGPFMFDHPDVRATQYASNTTGSGGPWDSSTVLDWVFWSDSWWR